MTDSKAPRKRTAPKVAEPTTETVEPVPTSAPAPAPTAAKAAPTPARSKSTMTFKRRMSQGDHGPAVAEVQRMLAQHKGWDGPEDGRYGTLLARAVRTFQGSQGMKPTGEVDLATWEALNR